MFHISGKKYCLHSAFPSEGHLQSGVKEAVDQIFLCVLTACHQECSFLGGRTDSWTKETFSKGRQSDLLHHNNILTQ